MAGFVFASGAHEGGVALADGGGERAPGVALVAQQRLAAVAPAALQQHQSDVAFVELWGGQFERAWSPVGAKEGMHPDPPEGARVRAAPAVVGGIGERR